MRSFFIETWGCQMNRHDSELIEGQLRALGMVPADDAEGADVVVLNTCSVRERPVQKIVNRISVLSRSPSPPVIGVCGCVAQQEGSSLLERSPAVGFVLGPGEVGRLPEALRAAAEGERRVLTEFDPEREHHAELIFRHSATRGMVTAVEGCNEFCTFCVVPYTRGRERSRALGVIVDEVRSLVSDGLCEVELLGQTINSYRCPVSGADFSDLLRAVAETEGLARLRYITSHPRHFDQKLIDTLASHPTVSRYLHLPFQSGSDRILRAMRRHTTHDGYLDLVRRIRAAVPDVNLSTDVIVGFPGEQEEDFLRTMELVETVRFGQVFAFVYSPRPRTPAARYAGRVEEAVAKERLQRLFELGDRISLELNEALVGRDVEVLVDGDSRRDPGCWQGRGEDNRVVNFPKTGVEAVGDLVDVRVVGATAHSLLGERALGAPLLLPTVDDGRGAA